MSTAEEPDVGSLRTPLRPTPVSQHEVSLHLAIPARFQNEVVLLKHWLHTEEIAVWDWLKRALKQTGRGASGWNYGRKGESWFEPVFVNKGGSDELRRHIRQLWDELLPNVPLHIEVRYDVPRVPR